MSGKIELETIKLAAIYKQPLKLDGTQMLHPLVDDLQKYLYKNIKEIDLDKFIETIKSNCKEFPNRHKLTELYNIFRPSTDETKQIGFTEADVVNNFSEVNDLPKFPPAGIDTSRNAMIEDERILDNKAMLKKYGVVSCGEFWKWIAENMTENELNSATLRFHSTGKYQYRCEKLNLCNYTGFKNPEYFFD